MSGGFTQDSEDGALLDMYVLAAADVPEPRICFLPTAMGDNRGYINMFEGTFAHYPCSTDCLNVIQPSLSPKKMAEKILTSDIIYVGGGNSKSMLALWREWGIDEALKEAYEQGVVLAGCSAGLVCWFEQCITDSIADRYSVMPCLGLLSGSATPHYGSLRQKAYHKALQLDLIAPGYGVEDSVALHFENDRLIRAVSSDAEAGASYVYKSESGKIEEEPVRTEYLGDREVFEKLVGAVIFPDLMEESSPLIQEVYQE